MKRVESCIVENCVPTPSSCITWNGGEVKWLGVCQGDPLNNLLWEIINKLEEVTGDDLESFDIDALVSVCKNKAPNEITLINILTMVKDNQLCLKDYVDKLEEKINELGRGERVEVNLKCLADFDNIGNSIIPDRKTLDQIVVDELCAQRKRLTTVEGEIINIKNNLGQPRESNSGEPTITTCVDGALKPTSQQVIKIAKDFCDLRTATGTPENIAQALSKTGSDWNDKYGRIGGWESTVTNEAILIGNMALIISNLEARLKSIETTCCAPSCENIKIGFAAVWNEDMTSILLKFSNAAGTAIPAGFLDKGSKVIVTDSQGNIEESAIGLQNNLEEEVFVYNLSTKGDVKITIQAKLGNESLTCEKEVSKFIRSTVCEYCEITASGDDAASAVIVYYDPTANNTATIPALYQPSSVTTTTTILV